MDSREMRSYVEHSHSWKGVSIQLGGGMLTPYVNPGGNNTQVFFFPLPYFQSGKQMT